MCWMEAPKAEHPSFNGRGRRPRTTIRSGLCSGFRAWAGNRKRRPAIEPGGPCSLLLLAEERIHKCIQFPTRLADLLGVLGVQRRLEPVEHEGQLVAHAAAEISVK